MRLEVLSRSPESVSKRSPILFVHGFWHGAWCWAENFLPYFEQRGYACFAPSLRGHAGSEGGEHLRWTAIADYVADVARVAGMLASPPIVIGHSMGGLIVQKYLETHEAPAAVLLASVPPTGMLATTLRFLVRHPLATLKAGLTLSVYSLVATPALYRSFFLSPGFPDDELRRIHARVQDDSFRALLDMVVLDLPKPREVKRTPMLVLGTDDFLVRARQVKATARAYGVEAEIFPGMGHAIMLDVGWRAVADRIAAWLYQQHL
jgi:pimeloyl-ACP methyl ester carboxylesterase